MELRLPHRRRGLCRRGARRTAGVAARRTCLVIDRRDHIGGNAYDHYDRAGVLLHTYGPHYFRTNSDRIVEYLSQFTEWHRSNTRSSRGRTGASGSSRSISTRSSNSSGALPRARKWSATLAEWRVPIAEPRNSEEVIVSQVGREALRDVLQKLHAQAMAARPARARRRASAGASPSARTATTAISRRNSRRCPGTATRDVQTHARASEDRGALEHRLPRGAAARALPAPHLHRRRSTSTSTTATARCPIARCASSPRRSSRNFSSRRCR